MLEHFQNKIYIQYYTVVDSAGISSVINNSTLQTPQLTTSLACAFSAHPALSRQAVFFDRVLQLGFVQDKHLTGQCRLRPAGIV